MRKYQTRPGFGFLKRVRGFIWQYQERLFEQLFPERSRLAGTTARRSGLNACPLNGPTSAAPPSGHGSTRPAKAEAHSREATARADAACIAKEI